jgi:hypothetical protein
MLVFVVPLQSPEVSRDWRKVSRLAERTLHSICRQKGDDFRVLLVCNKSPDGNFSDSRLSIIEEPFPIPGRSRDERMADKTRKIQRALIQARDWAPFHLMCVDADDCVSNRLAAFVAQHPTARGWYFKTGYVHDAGSLLIFRRRAFHLFCGSSHIVRCERDDLPRAATGSEADYWVLEHGHSSLEMFLRDRGTPLAPLPFPGAIYNTATGENDSGFSLGQWRSRKVLLQKLLRYRWFTRAIREEFGFYEIQDLSESR